MFCTQCGKPLNNDDKFCKYCGAPVQKGSNIVDNIVKDEYNATNKTAKAGDFTQLNTLYYISNLMPILIFICSFGVGSITHPFPNSVGIEFLVIFCALSFAYLKISKRLLDKRREAGWIIPVPQLLKINSKFINIVFLFIGFLGVISAFGNYYLYHNFGRSLSTVVVGASLLVVRYLFNRYVKKYI